VACLGDTIGVACKQALWVVGKAGWGGKVCALAHASFLHCEPLHLEPLFSGLSLGVYLLSPCMYVLCTYLSEYTIALPAINVRLIL
jgi:hypothetical protein